MLLVLMMIIIAVAVSFIPSTLWACVAVYCTGLLLIAAFFKGVNS